MFKKLVLLPLFMLLLLAVPAHADSLSGGTLTSPLPTDRIPFGRPGGDATAKRVEFQGLRNWLWGESNVFVPSNNTCGADVTAELTAFALAHNGYVNVRQGDCLKVGDLGVGISATTSLHLNCPTYMGCELRHDNDKSAILYHVPDNVALERKQIVTSVGVATINKDDAAKQYVTVNDITGYNRGDFVLIMDAVSNPDDPPSLRNILNVSWNGSACVVQTSGNHGYSSTQRINVKSIVGTGSFGTNLVGADGWGRTYNITVIDSDEFSLQALDNATDTTDGSNVDCSSGAYTSGGTVSRQNTWASEAAKVLGADPVTKRIYLEAPLQMAPLYVQQPVIFRYTEARKFSVNNFRIRPSGNPDDFTMQESDASIDVLGVPVATFTNLYFDDVWDAGIFNRGNPGSISRNIAGNRMVNRATYGSSTSSRVITNITVGAEAVFTYYNESGSTSPISSLSEIGLSALPTGYTSLANKLYRVSDSTGSNCGTIASTCTFKLKDTFGNYVSTVGFPTFTGTATSGDPDNVTGLGYLQSHQSACYSCTIDGMYGFNGRHLFTSGTSQLSWFTTPGTSSQLVRYGSPTYGLVQNVKSSAGDGRAIDTHEATYKYHFNNITISYSQRGILFGSYEGAWGQDRGGDNTYSNITTEGGKQGLRIVASNRFKPMYFDLRNISCLNQDAADGSDKCLEIQDWSSFANKPTVYLSGYFNATGVSTPISIGKTAIVRSTANIALRDFDDGINCQAGSQFESDGLFLTDFRNPRMEASWTHKPDAQGDGFNAIILRSDSTNGGCTARVGGTAVNYQGTGSTKLTNFFYRADTTATKYYYLNSFHEYDPSTAGASTEVSNTTSMTLLSDVKTLVRPTILRVPNSTTLPSSCTVGDIYFDTDAASGKRIYGCESANTWVLQGPASGASRKYLTFEVPGTLATGDGSGARCAEMPAGYNGLVVTEVLATVAAAGSGGSANLIQLRNVTDGVDVLSTRAMIDASETSSSSAATPYVINTSNDDVTTGDVLCVDIDQLNTTPPTSLRFAVGFE